MWVFVAGYEQHSWVPFKMRLNYRKPCFPLFNFKSIYEKLLSSLVLTVLQCDSCFLLGVAADRAWGDCLKLNTRFYYCLMDIVFQLLHLNLNLFGSRPEVPPDFIWGTKLLHVRNYFLCSRQSVVGRRLAFGLLASFWQFNIIRKQMPRRGLIARDS